MEDKDTNPAPRPSTPVSRPVMDVQRPVARPPLTTVGEDPKPVVEAPVAVEPDKTPEAPVVPTEAPADTSTAKPSFDVAAAMAEANKTPSGAAAPDAKDAQAAHAQADHLLAAHSKKGHKPIIPIMIAVVVALVLGAVTVFAYLKTQSHTKGGGDVTDTMTHTETQTPAVTSEDVDAADKAVDTAAGANDATDMPESDLSDATLGL